MTDHMNNKLTTLRQKNNGSRISLALIVIPIVIIFFLELVVFNLNFWQTCTLNEVNLTQQSQLSSSKWLIPAQGDIKTLNIKVKTKMTIRVFV